jgi:hypothetical protein
MLSIYTSYFNIKETLLFACRHECGNFSGKTAHSLGILSVFACIKLMKHNTTQRG